MIKTIKELLIEWWADSTTSKTPVLTIYIEQHDDNDIWYSFHEFEEVE